MKIKNIFLSFLFVTSSAQAIVETKKIHHPGSEQGLVAIKKDGSYIYRTEPKPTNRSGHFKIGFISPPKIETTYVANGVDSVLKFEDMYTTAKLPFITYEYEWRPFENIAGFGLQAGGGFFYTEGRGRLTSTNQESEEKFSFIGLPLEFGGVFRIQVGQRPWIAPYVAGGGLYFLTAEKRDDKAMPKFFGVFGSYAAGGALINISKLDRETAFTLENEYGFSNLWLTLEIKLIKTFSENLEMEDAFFNGGFTVDY